MKKNQKQQGVGFANRLRLLVELAPHYHIDVSTLTLFPAASADPMTHAGIQAHIDLFPLNMHIIQTTKV